MANAAAKTKPVEDATTAAPLDAALPEIAPSCVEIEANLFDRRVLVRMPEGTVSDDLRDSRIWRKLQATRVKALRQLDSLLILGSDESWYARALCTHATHKDAAIVIEKVGSFRAVKEQLYSDGEFRVFFEGGSYVIKRVADGVRMDNAGYGTEMEAVRALANIHPRSVNY